MRYKVRVKKPVALIASFILGCSLMPLAIDSAKNFRGCDAVGGKFLVPFLFILITALIYEFRDLKE